MAPQPAERRILVILWLGMVASIGFYFVLIQMVQPRQPRANSTLVSILLLTAVSMVAASFPIKSRLRATHAEQLPMLVALALCETAGLCGVVVWFTTAWPYYYVFLLLGLAGLLLHYPGGGLEK